MPDAKCTPGQDGTWADARLPVVLAPVFGDFGINGGTVSITSKDNGQSLPMGAETPWLSQVVVANLPPTGPWTGDDDERFRIEVTPDGADGVTYVADPVEVRGPEGSGWPPTHGPDVYATPGQGISANSRLPVVLTPVFGTFGVDGGKIRIVSKDNGESSLMEVVEPWLSHELVAKIPETGPGTGDENERFTIEVTPTEGATYVADSVEVRGPEGSGWPPAQGPDLRVTVTPELGVHERK